MLNIYSLVYNNIIKAHNSKNINSSQQTPKPLCKNKKLNCNDFTTMEECNGMPNPQAKVIHSCACTKMWDEEKIFPGVNSRYGNYCVWNTDNNKCEQHFGKLTSAFRNCDNPEPKSCEKTKGACCPIKKLSSNPFFIYQSYDPNNEICCLVSSEQEIGKVVSIDEKCNQ